MHRDDELHERTSERVSIEIEFDFTVLISRLFIISKLSVVVFFLSAAIKRRMFPREIRENVNSVCLIRTVKFTTLRDYPDIIRL